jgi:protein gp37
VGDTNIEWTDKTWNPTEGCTMAKGSEAGGCLNCYAARTALRRPASGLAVMRDSGPRWTGKVQLVESRLTAPLHWRTPRRIFVNSMSDLFHERLELKSIAKVYAVIGLSLAHRLGHQYQILTKRPDRRLSLFNREDFWSQVEQEMDEICGKRGWCSPGMPDFPFSNAWEGVSVENFATWDSRAHLLKATPAATRFVSYEPALEDLGCVDLEGIDWLIVGGESGPGARPFDIQWARTAIEQCKEAGVACFVKQLGRLPFDSRPPWQISPGTQIETPLSDRKGGDMSEWPEDLRVREFPEVSSR